MVTTAQGEYYNPTTKTYSKQEIPKAPSGTKYGGMSVQTSTGGVQYGQGGTVEKVYNPSGTVLYSSTGSSGTRQQEVAKQIQTQQITQPTPQIQTQQITQPTPQIGGAPIPPQIDIQRQNVVQDMLAAQKREQAEQVQKQLTQSQINAQRYREAVIPTDKTKYNLPSLKYDITKKYSVTQSEEIKPLVKLKEQVRKVGMPGKVVGEFIPTSTGGLVITGGLVTTAILAPPVVGAVIGLGIGGLGAKAAFTKDLPVETRIAGGIGGALGFLGASTIIKPYVKGQLVKLSPSYKPVVTQPEGYSAITKVPEVEKIGLIPEKYPIKTGETADINLPETSPLVRGGFNVKDYDPFVGKDQYLTSSLRGVKVKEGELKTEGTLWVSPQEPTLKIPETRVSRLGLIEPIKTSKEYKISWSLGEQPQIFLTKADVLAKESATAFQIGPKTGELQAIKTFGELTIPKKIGVTTIKGQAVDIYRFDLADKISGLSKDIEIIKPKTTTPVREVSGYTLLSGLLAPKTTIKTTQIASTKITPTIITPSVPTPRTTTPTTTITKPITKPIGFSSVPSKPNITTTIPSQPTPKTTTPSIPPSRPTTPSIPPRVPSYPRIPPSRPTIPPSKPTYPISRPHLVTRVPTYPTKSSGLTTGLTARRKSKEAMFISEIRRLGVWKAVTKPTTYQKAYGLGIKRARETLGVSVRVRIPTGRIVRIPTPSGFVRGKKEPSIIVEQRRFRLKKFPQRGEVSEIQLYKRAAARKKEIFKIRIPWKKKRNQRSWFLG